MKLHPRRLALIGLLLLAAFYLPWLFRSANYAAPWLVLPFLAANVSVLANTVLHGINNWDRRIPTLQHIARGDEPAVAVIIPTYGEPVDMVINTVWSVLRQDYPADKLTVVVSDDGRSYALAEAVTALADSGHGARLLYHRPPTKSDPLRRGEGKAGNLNSAYLLLDKLGVDAPFVETRDADDLVGDPAFLRVCTGQLTGNPSLAYVQTIKTCEVDPGDPFGNLNPTFYQGVMYAKNATGSVYPCGSGLLWRRRALDDIGGFPAWNLVEDVQSGVLAMRRGWRGEYLPIVGAHGQHAPNDLPNMYKQRGTWALDTMRLMFWGRMGGMTLRQRLHFSETFLFYLNSVAWVALSFTTVATLASGQPLIVGRPINTTVYLWTMFLALELFHAAHGFDHGFAGVWRNRQIWANLSFLWTGQIARAFLGGPLYKPRYRVTRKDSAHGIFLRMVWPQVVSVIALITALVIWLIRSDGLANADPSGLYWAMFFLLIYGTFLPRAWFGMGPQLSAPRFTGHIMQAARRLFDTPSVLHAHPQVLRVMGTDEQIGGLASGRVTAALLDGEVTELAEPKGELIALDHHRDRRDAAPSLRIGVLGSGMAGVSIARLLRDSGHDVTVWEAKGTAGGMASSFMWHGIACDHGPHRLLPDNETILADLATLVELRTLRRSSKIRLQNRWVSEPINPFELVAKFLPRRGLALVWDYLRRDRNGPDGNFDEQSLSRFGVGLTEMFFRPYSEKLFGIPATEISPWWGRRKLRAAGLKDLLKKTSRLSFSEFYYPVKGGYGAIVEALAAQLGPQLRFGHRVTQIERNAAGGYVCEFRRDDDSTVTEAFDLLISSLPTTLTAKLLGCELDLKFRPADLYYLHLNKPRVTPFHWFYFADGMPESVINRVSEFANFGTPSEEPGTSVLCCEVTAINHASLDRVVAELAQAELITPDDVLDHKIVHLPAAYPVYDLQSDVELPKMTAFFEQHPDLFHVGRNATFAHEDVDEIYVQAREVLQHVMARANQLQEQRRRTRPRRSGQGALKASRSAS